MRAFWPVPELSRIWGLPRKIENHKIFHNRLLSAQKQWKKNFSSKKALSLLKSWGSLTWFTIFRKTNRQILRKVFYRKTNGQTNGSRKWGTYRHENTPTFFISSSQDPIIQGKLQLILVSAAGSINTPLQNICQEKGISCKFARFSLKFLWESGRYHTKNFHQKYVNMSFLW